VFTPASLLLKSISSVPADSFVDNSIERPSINQMKWTPLELPSTESANRPITQDNNATPYSEPGAVVDSFDDEDYFQYDDMSGVTEQLNTSPDLTANYPHRELIMMQGSSILDVLDNSDSADNEDFFQYGDVPGVAGQGNTMPDLSATHPHRESSLKQDTSIRDVFENSDSSDEDFFQYDYDIMPGVDGQGNTIPDLSANLPHRDSSMKQDIISRDEFDNNGNSHSDDVVMTEQSWLPKEELVKNIKKYQKIKLPKDVLDDFPDVDYKPSEHILAELNTITPGEAMERGCAVHFHYYNQNN